MKKKYIVGLKVLPGEPTNGSGKVCVHLFIQDEKGPFTEPCVIHRDEEGKPVAKPTKGRLACNPKRLVAPREVKGVTNVTMRTDDPRAATCPKCIASPDYQCLMQLLNGALAQ